MEYHSLITWQPPSVWSSQCPVSNMQSVQQWIHGSSYDREGLCILSSPSVWTWPGSHVALSTYTQQLPGIVMIHMAYLVTMPRSQNMENMAAGESHTGIIRGMKLNLLKSEYVSLKLWKDFDTSFVTSSSGTFNIWNIMNKSNKKVSSFTTKN